MQVGLMKQSSQIHCLQSIVKIKEDKSKFDSIYPLSVTRPGFEPRQSEPESEVLPLYYRAMNFRQI
jgi:hypothetical protein